MLLRCLSNMVLRTSNDGDYTMSLGTLVHHLTVKKFLLITRQNPSCFGLYLLALTVSPGTTVKSLAPTSWTSWWVLAAHQVPLNPSLLHAEPAPVPQPLLAGHMLHSPWGNSLSTAATKICSWLKGKQEYTSAPTSNLRHDSEVVPSVRPRSAGNLQLRFSHRLLPSGSITGDMRGTGIEGRRQTIKSEQTEVH